MRNYLTRRNDNTNGWGLNFWEDPFEEFFKPVFGGEGHNFMRTDVKETAKGYELSIDLPGFDKSDIGVSLNDGYLTIEAKRNGIDEDKNNYIRRERNYSCSRSYYVGDGVTEKDVKAKYNNGILSLTVPKKEEKEIRHSNIEIE